MARFIQCHRSLQIHVSVYWSQICFSLKLTDVQLLILEGFHRHFSPERSEKPITGWYGILHAGISSALLPDRFKQCQKKREGRLCSVSRIISSTFLSSILILRFKHFHICLFAELGKCSAPVFQFSCLVLYSQILISPKSSIVLNLTLQISTKRVVMKKQVGQKTTKTSRTGLLRKTLNK